MQREKEYRVFGKITGSGRQQIDVRRDSVLFGRDLGGIHEGDEATASVIEGQEKILSKLTVLCVY